MTQDAAVDRILQRVVPGACVDRSVLGALFRNRPGPEGLVPLLAAADPPTVRAAVLYLGLYGSMPDCPVLALCLHHEDGEVAKLAEHCLWSIWMRGGTPTGNRQLATGIRSMEAGRFRQAIQIFQRLATSEPTFAEAHFQHGLALCSAERPEEAAEAYRRSLQLNPYHFAAAASLGHAYVEQGNLSAALHCYRQALRIHPRLEDVPEAIKELESVLGTRPRHDA